MTASCPICRKPVEVKYRPFCSKHCADVDLARWLNGRYVVPGTEGDAAETTTTEGDNEG